MVALVQDDAFARWDDVRLFLAAYRLKTLGEAARRMGVDTSTMSRRLSAFEEALGVRLFERTRSGLVPTRAAEFARVAAESMEAAHARLKRDTSGDGLHVEGLVRVSAAPGEAERLVMPTVLRLRSLFPALTIELDASPRTVDVARGEADLALRSVAPRGAELVVTRLGAARWVIAGASSLVTSLGRVQSFDDTPWILWDRDLTTFGPVRWAAAHARGARVVFRSSHFNAQLRAAGEGLGLMLLPEPYVRAAGLELLSTHRSLAPAMAQLPVDALWLVAHRTQLEVPRIRAVWRALTEDVRRALSR
jgi:DNA-binding transcriptional LysR family regulator